MVVILINLSSLDLVFACVWSCLCMIVVYGHDYNLSITSCLCMIVYGLYTDYFGNCIITFSY